MKETRPIGTPNPALTIESGPLGLRTHPEFALRCYVPDGILSSEPHMLAFYGHTKAEMVWLQSLLYDHAPDFGTDLEQWQGGGWRSVHSIGDLDGDATDA